MEQGHEHEGSIRMDGARKTEFIPCLKCEHRLSEQAKKCPKCDTDVLICRICGWRMMRSTAIFMHGYSYHRKCIDEMFAMAKGVACPACKTVFSLRDLTLTPHQVASHERLHQFPCPSCGHPSLFGYCGSCDVCSLPVYEASNGWRAGSWSDVTYRHHACATRLNTMTSTGIPKLSELVGTQTEEGSARAGCAGVVVIIVASSLWAVIAVATWGVVRELLP
jgi:hypothetical protein